MTLYDDLGLEPDATEAQIKAARRRAAKRNHPDMDGGDRERFDASERAFMVLIDPVRRQRYDETGQADQTTGAQADLELRKAIQETLAGMIRAVADGSISLEHHDVARQAQTMLRDQRAVVVRRLEEHERALARIKALRKRFVKKRKHSPLARFVLDGFDAHIEKAGLPVAQHRDALALQDRLIEAFRDFDYEFTTPDASYRSQPGGRSGPGFYEPAGRGFPGDVPTVEEASHLMRAAMEATLRRPYGR